MRFLISLLVACRDSKSATASLHCAHLTPLPPPFPLSPICRTLPLTRVSHVGSPVERVGSVLEGRSCQLPAVQLGLYVTDVPILSGAMSVLYLLLQETQVYQSAAAGKAGVAVGTGTPPTSGVTSLSFYGTFRGQ